MTRPLRTVALLLYYGFARWLPTQPVPGWRLGYSLRRLLLRGVLDELGQGVLVKSNCYLGDGTGIRVGDHSQLGARARIDHDVTIGRNVIMGPEVVIMTSSHAFEDPERLIRDQGAADRRGVNVGNDVWIGTRVVVLPGVSIGEGSVIGAGSVVTRSVPPFSVVAGVPAKVIRRRGSRLSGETASRTKSIVK